MLVAMKPIDWEVIRRMIERSGMQVEKLGVSWVALRLIELMQCKPQEPESQIMSSNCNSLMSLQMLPRHCPASLDYMWLIVM
jgi:hypothetical protein